LPVFLRYSAAFRRFLIPSLCIRSAAAFSRAFFCSGDSLEKFGGVGWGVGIFGKELSDGSIYVDFVTWPVRKPHQWRESFSHSFGTGQSMVSQYAPESTNQSEGAVVEQVQPDPRLASQGGPDTTRLRAQQTTGDGVDASSNSAPDNTSPPERGQEAISHLSCSFQRGTFCSTQRGTSFSVEFFANV